MPPKALNVLRVFVLAAVLTACSPAAQSNQLDANLQKWQSQEIAHYKMKVGIRCFCPFGSQMPVSVEVRDGQLVSVVDNAGNPVSEGDPILEPENARLLTVEGLFESARKAMDNADNTTIEYDPDLGYPLSLSIDWWKDTGDDNEGATVTDFQPLP